MSNNALVVADKSAKGVHTEIMALLTDVKAELEAFALANGIDKEQLERITKEQRVGMSGPAANSTLPLSGSAAQKMTAKSISEEISFMVDELGRINADASTRQNPGATSRPTTATPATDAGSVARAKQVATTDSAYQKMINAYKVYLNVMTANPADKTGIEAAKATYDTAQETYQKALQPAR